MTETRHSKGSNGEGKKMKIWDIEGMGEMGKTLVASHMSIWVPAWMGMPKIGTQAIRGEASLDEGC